jgi:hypothetical protein
VAPLRPPAPPFNKLAIAAAAATAFDALGAYALSVGHIADANGRLEPIPGIAAEIWAVVVGAAAVVLAAKTLRRIDPGRERGLLLAIGGIVLPLLIALFTLLGN